MGEDYANNHHASMYKMKISIQVGKIMPPADSRAGANGKA